MQTHQTRRRVGAIVGTAMVGLAAALAVVFSVSAGKGDAAAADEPQQLAVLWTSGDPEVAHRVALMYTHGAARQGWFDQVRLIVWGPSARLLAADKDVQAYVARLKEAGVHVQACVVCADSYGVTEKLRELDLEVKAMGRPLTDYMQDDAWDVLTF